MTSDHDDARVTTEPEEPRRDAAEPVEEELPSIWRNRAFVQLFTGETVGAVGVEIAQVAMPIIAVTYLAATEVQIGYLTMVEGLAFLALSLPVGAWVDRVSRRKVLIGANIVRAVAMAMVPVLWFTGGLSVSTLWILALVLSGAQVFFDMAYLAIVPSIVDHRQLGHANSTLQTSAETARAAGPGIGGFLARFVAAPVLPFFATAGYLISAFNVWRLPSDEPAPREHGSRIVDEIREGFTFVWRHPLIRPLLISTAMFNLFGSVMWTMFPVLLLRSLGVSEATFGLIISATAVGGIVGAFSARYFVKVFGEGRSIAVAAGIEALLILPLLFVFAMPRTPAILMVTVTGFFSVMLVVVFNVVQVTMRQKQCPPALLGRMTASLRMVMWGVGPIGAFASGYIATWFGLTVNFSVALAGSIAAALVLFASPLGRLRDVPLMPVDLSDLKKPRRTPE